MSESSATIPGTPTELDFSRIPPDALDEQQHIVCELPCRQCGYNLQTLHAQGSCPECGTAVHWSLIGDLLRFADADWLDKLSRGMLWVLLPTAAGFVTTIFISIAMGFTGSSGGVEALSLVVGALVTLASGVGYWKLTTPEPQPDPMIVPSAGARGWARGLLMTATTISVISHLLTIFTLDTGNTPFGQQPGVLAPLIEAMDILALLLGIAGSFCLAVVLRHLAGRAPRPGMARETSGLIWAWAVWLVLATLGIAAIFVIDWLTPNTLNSLNVGGGAALAVTGCGGVLLGFLLGIWTLILMIRYHLLLKRHAGYARFRVPQQPVRSLHF